MTSIITADIHMTTAVREDYRFGLFSWLAEQARTHEVDQVLILGDLTERHDRHPSQLVNRLVLGVSEIAEVCPVYIIKGNHDCVDADWPFFGFLSGIPNVTFFSDPERINLRIRGERARCALLPSCDDPVNDWKEQPFGVDDFIFMHQTVIGAAYESGMPADKGLPLSFFHGTKAEIFSGDVHSPQRIGTRPAVTYVGAPYRVDFGDRYTPRCLLLAPDGDRNLRFPCPMKHALDVTGDGEIRLPKGDRIAPGDHVRVRVRLTREQLTVWPRIRATLIAMGKQERWGAVIGPSLELLPSDAPNAPQPIPSHERLNPLDALNRFCAAKKLDDDTAGVGAAIMEEASR
jgi:hypothetical protein